ncbi:MAG: prephenate dehydratase [Deltaproteobacteria bacterium]|nr:prephenate dehydratase [Deltaproteobacteria bacterium]
MSDKLAKIRLEIDELDQRLVALLNQRACLALEVARTKAAGGVEEFAPAREHQVLSRLARENRGPLANEALQGVFSEIIGACRSLQRALKVAYLGPETTFTHQAALRRFGGTSQFAAQRSIEDVFQEVERGHSEVGVVPVENSSEGGVSVTLDQFLVHDLTVCGEIYTPIRHMLMSRTRELDAVKKVYSHPQALAQCRQWLSRNLPQAALVEAASTVAAARLAAAEPGTAAVGSRLAARRLDLPILAEGIQDNPHNMTRFFVLGRQACPATGEDKTSVLFVTHHHPGALFGALKPLSDRGLNMTRIESRPIKDRPWEYAFFVDFEGHRDDEVVAVTLSEMESHLEYLKVLGSYPRALLPARPAE